MFIDVSYISSCGFDSTSDFGVDFDFDLDLVLGAFSETVVSFCVRPFDFFRPLRPKTDPNHHSLQINTDNF